MGKVFFLSYDGMTDPLGSSQIWPYIRGLSGFGWKHTVFSFEKPDRFKRERARVAQAFAAHGTRWIPLPYHQRPAVPATLFDLSRMVLTVTRHALKDKPVLLHARGAIPGFGARAVSAACGAPVVYDMRGFWADEKVMASNWNQHGPVYRVVKAGENALFESARAIVSLTEAGKRELETWPKIRAKKKQIAVIPTCVDLERFTPKFREAATTPLSFGYIGSMNRRYLMDKVVFVVRALFARFPSATFKVFTRDHVAPLWEACDALGVDKARVEVSGVPYRDVPEALSGLAASFALYTPGFAALGTCPTKLGEALATGCPVVVNRGVGDCAEIVEQHRCGVVAELSEAGLTDAAQRLGDLIEHDPNHRQRCLEAAKSWFGLAEGVKNYDRLYRSILLPETAPAPEGDLNPQPQ